MLTAETTLGFQWNVVVYNRTNGNRSITPAASLEKAQIAASVFVGLMRALGGATPRELKDGTVRLTNAAEVIDVRVEGRRA